MAEGCAHKMNVTDFHSQRKMNVLGYIRIYVCAYVCVCVCACVRARVGVNLCVCTHTHTISCVSASAAFICERCKGKR